MVLERPLNGRGRVVKTQPPLRRTRPSDWGVAPDTARGSRSATGGPAALPHDLVGAVDTDLPPCESPEGKIVKRSPASFSHSGAA